jgi:hypothetical protein
VTVLNFRGRRVARFARIVERFDLVGFQKVAGWSARDPGDHMTATEDRRRQAYSDLIQSVLDGEFGVPRKPCVAYLPLKGGGALPGRLLLRLVAGHIASLKDFYGGATPDDDRSGDPIADDL